MRNARISLAFAVLLAATGASADTVEATSTTWISSAKQPRGGAPGEQPELVGVTPIFEVVTVAARGIRNPAIENLDVVVSTWGSLDLQDPRWDNGTDRKLTGDVVTGYVRGQLLSRRLTFQLGRGNVAVGAGRVASIDGGSLALRLPFGVGLSAYAGAPVAQRFSGAGALASWNAMGGDLAYGGRASLSLSLPLPFLRALEVGGSAAFVDDGGEAARRDAGVDARLRLFGDLAVNGWALWAIEDQRLAEATAVVTWHPARRWFVTADWRHVAPDLMLPRTSVLSVFANATRDDVGGGVRWEVAHGVEGGLDYHALLEPDGEGGTTLGHELTARGDYVDGPVKAGGELAWLDGAENGYLGARFYVRRQFGRITASGDLNVYVFQEAINAQDYSASAVATVGYDLGKAWTASVTGRAGVTPFMEQQADVMVKLAYNQTYRVREVR